MLYTFKIALQAIYMRLNKRSFDFFKKYFLILKWYIFPVIFRLAPEEHIINLLDFFNTATSVPIFYLKQYLRLYVTKIIIFCQ